MIATEAVENMHMSEVAATAEPVESEGDHWLLAYQYSAGGRWFSSSTVFTTKQAAIDYAVSCAPVRVRLVKVRLPLLSP